MSLNTDNFEHCIKTLEVSLVRLKESDPEDIEYEIFRNAVIKGFELTLETAGKLLRKGLKLFTGNPRQVDALNYKDLLRYGAKHDLMAPDEVERWFFYRDNRNDTAHDYGVGFAEETLKLLPEFIADAHTLETVLRKRLGNEAA